jgi:hypothetical protein
MSARKPIQERFANKYRVLPSLGCWEWTGSKDNHGYGRIEDNGKPKLASRVAYELRNGPIPNGLVLDHFQYPDACIGPNCCNPDHLLPTTRSANAGRTSWARKTHCPAGHEYTPANTLVRNTGRGGSGKGRCCKTCHKAQVKRWQRDNREKVRGYRRKRRKQLGKHRSAIRSV